jgi:hypothetical protein
MNNQSEIDKLLGILKKTGNAVHLKKMDMTWDLNNQLVNSIEMLNILLTKTSCLPLVPDFRDQRVKTTLNINDTQAETIQGFNKQLLYISGVVHKYIIENYVVLSVSKKMMDDTIDQLPQSDMSYLLNFLKNYENNNKMGGEQKGGQLPVGFLKSFLFIFILLLISSTSQMEENNLEIIDNEMYSKGLKLYSPEEFTNKILQLPVVSSGPINMNNMLVKYDDKVKQELETTYGQFVAIFRQMDNSTVKLQNFIKEFNTQSRNFSQGVERNCLDLMKKCKEKNVFKEWKNVDTLDETKEKINELNKKVEEQNEQNEGMVGKAFGATIGLVTLPFTGDYMTPVSYITGLGDDIYEKFKNTNDINKEKRKILSEQKSTAEEMKLSQFDQIEFEQKIYQFSKVYCSLGYNLQIVANDTSISIQGDNVPYLFMINLITTLDKNLNNQIDQLSITQNDENQKILQALVSLRERLSVLKSITESLDSVINITSKMKLLKLERYANEESLNDFESFFNNQLLELQKMLNDLNKQFPLRAQKLEEEAKIAEQKAELNALEADIEDFKANSSAILRQRSAERSARENTDWFKSIKTVAESWTDIGFDLSSFVGEKVGEVPLALIREVLKFLNKVLYELLINPSGIVIMFVGLFTITFMLGGIMGTIRIFKKGGQLCVTLMYGGICFVYKLVKTPFGYLWKLQGTLYIDNNNNNNNNISNNNNNNNNIPQITYDPNNMTDDQLASSAVNILGNLNNPNTKYGGRKRKTHKIKKNKTKIQKNKTKIQKNKTKIQKNKTKKNRKTKKYRYM